MLARIRRRWASATVGPPTPRAPRSRRLTVAAGRRLFVPDLNEAHAILAGAREGGYEMNNSPDWLAIPPRGRSALADPGARPDGLAPVQKDDR
jgi:hypothetical protein